MALYFHLGWLVGEKCSARHEYQHSGANDEAAYTYAKKIIIRVV